MSLKKHIAGLIVASQEELLRILKFRGIMKVQGILAAIKTTMGGLNTQMRRMELISDNIANAEKTPDKDGNVYKRKVLVSDAKNNTGKFSEELKLKLNRSSNNHFQPGLQGSLKNREREALEVVEQDSEISVFEPNHPMADENGYVRKPDVNMVEEMVDLISTTRMYEANVTVINAAKNMAKKSMEI
jgi:flagellar basal-body rod protein FlgC